MGKRFVFEIPSTCIEEVTVTAETIEEAIQILNDSEDSKYSSCIPEIEWNGDTFEDGVLETLLARTYKV